MVKDLALLGNEKALELVEAALKASPGDQTEVLVSNADSYLTRFANNYIHQNVAERNATLTVRVVFGKKIGVASTNDLDAESVRRTVDQAAMIARLQKDNPEFVSLPGPEPVPEVAAWSDETARFGPDELARGVAAVIAAARSGGLEAAGAFSTTVSELAVGNSLGVRAYQKSTVAALSTVFMGESQSGYAQARSRDVGAIDPGAVAGQALEKALASSGAKSVDPGEYEVILEPEAVADMLGFFVRSSFSAMAYQEGRSYLQGKLGQKLFPDSVSIWDDGLDPVGLPQAFDFEGVPKRRVMLVDRGVPVNLLYDSYTAGREPGRTSTGHAGPAMAGGFGPMAGNLFMAAGDASIEDMIRATKKGILVTRFHYTNPVSPVRTLLTGMTRDGTFLIEDGRITAPVKNFRFTQSIADALAGVEMVGRERRFVGGWRGGSLVPALKIARFAFTGVTEF